MKMLALPSKGTGKARPCFHCSERLMERQSIGVRPHSAWFTVVCMLGGVVGMCYVHVCDVCYDVCVVCGICCGVCSVCVLCHMCGVRAWCLVWCVCLYVL